MYDNNILNGKVFLHTRLTYIYFSYVYFLNYYINFILNFNLIINMLF